MIEILIALIAVTGFGVYGAVISSKRWDREFMVVMCSISALLGFTALLAYAAAGFSYFGAAYKADIINREYNSNYTQQEVFYASDVIDEIRNLDRKRIEINGNLITGKK